MSHMEPIKFSFEVKELDSVSFTWYFKNWSEYHKFFSSKVESFINIKDVKLRFFLYPFERIAKFTHPNDHEKFLEYYSLCAQIVSEHRKVNLKVKTESTTGIGKSSCVTLEKSAKNPKGIATVEQEFLNVGVWYFDQGEKHLHSTWQDKFLLIVFQVTLFECIQNVPTKMELEQTSFIKVNENLLSIKIQEFLKQNKEIPFSDVTLKMKDNIAMKGHRLILASASPVFEAMFMSDMKESQTQTVEIPDITSEVMNIIIRYIYSGELDPSWEIFLEEVIYAGNKYQLDGLVNYCDKALISICTPGNVMKLIKLANTHNLPTAVEELKKYAELHAVEILMNQLETT